MRRHYLAMARSVAVLGAVLIAGDLCLARQARQDLSFSPSGVPYYFSDGRPRWIRHPGAVVEALVVGVETPVLRPSGAEADATAEYLATALPYYSIVSVEIQHVVSGDAPDRLDLFWKPHVRTVDGRLVKTWIGDPQEGYGPLVPGMRILIHVVRPMESLLGIAQDRRFGLWDVQGPVFFEPSEDIVYRKFTVDPAALNVLGRESSAAGPSKFAGAVRTLEEESLDRAIQKLQLQYSDNAESWAVWEAEDEVR